MIGRIRRKDKAFETYYLHVLNIQMDVFELTGNAPILPLLPVKPEHFTDKQKIKAIALNILGINRICQLNKILHKVWRSR